MKAPPLRRVALGAALALCACRDRSARDAKGAAAPAAAPAPAAVDGGDASPLASAAAQPELVLLTGVVVKTVDPEGAPPRELYPHEVGQKLGRLLADSGQFVADPQHAPPGYRLRRARIDVSVTYDLLAEGSTGVPAVLAAVEARVVWEQDAEALPEVENVLSERPYRRDEQAVLDGIIAEHVERTVLEAGRGLIAKESIRAGEPAAVAVVLRGNDDDAIEFALAVVADRRMTDAYDAVVALLASPKEAVRDAAIGALVALRDARAVASLTKLADFQDYALMRRVIEAVTAIGGDDAEVYLEFVSTGHPDGDIRQQATEGLERLKRRQGQRVGARP